MNSPNYSVWFCYMKQWESVICWPNINCLKLREKPDLNYSWRLNWENAGGEWRVKGCQNICLKSSNVYVIFARLLWPQENQRLKFTSWFVFRFREWCRRGRIFLFQWMIERRAAHPRLGAHFLQEGSKALMNKLLKPPRMIIEGSLFKFGKLNVENLVDWIMITLL